MNNRPVLRSARHISMATTLVLTLGPMVTVKLATCTILFLFHLIWPFTDLTNSSFAQCPGPLYSEGEVFDTGKFLLFEPPFSSLIWISRLPMSPEHLFAME